MKILFLAFYFEPYPGVGSKRISYWAKNIKELVPQSTVDVITSPISKSPEEVTGVDRIYTIPTESRTLYSRFCKFDLGAGWYFPLKEFLTKELSINEYDYVIFTGNPYFHFPLARIIENNGVKTVLDFRDPMAKNPRAVKADNLKRKIKYMLIRRLETWLISKSTKSISVNRYCKSLLDRRVFHKVEIIDNGYDEKVFDGCDPHTEITANSLFYAGSLYSDRSPYALVECLKSSNFTFHHIGPVFEGLHADDNIVLHGVKSYKETIDLSRSFEVGLIFTSGYNFESTTKIFDYIALKKKILIITEQEVKTGALHEITCEYPLVEWATNDSTSILEALSRLKSVQCDLANFDTTCYSRKFGLRKLVSILDENK